MVKILFKMQLIIQNQNIKTLIKEKKLVELKSVRLGQRDYRSKFKNRSYYLEETVNQHTFLNMLKIFFCPKHYRVESHKKKYFQQDGATP